MDNFGKKSESVLGVQLKVKSFVQLDWIGLDWIGFTSGYRVATALGIVYWTSLSILGLAASRLVRLFPVNNPPQGYNCRKSIIMQLMESVTW